MKPFGEKLYFERSEAADKATAGLVRRVLKNRGENKHDTYSHPPSLFKRLEDWLREGNIRPILLLGVEDIKVCAGIIKTQVEIAEETPGINETNGTSTPQNISLAKGLLPEMEEFVSTHSLVSE